jgi:hypothetical protein
MPNPAVQRGWRIKPHQATDLERQFSRLSYFRKGSGGGVAGG